MPPNLARKGIPMAVLPRLTYDDLRELPDDGKRYELLEGVLYMSPAPSRAWARYSSRFKVLSQFGFGTRRAHPGGEDAEEKPIGKAHWKNSLEKLTGKFTGNLTAETQRNAEKHRGKAQPRRSGDAPKNCRVRPSRTPTEKKRKREKICSSVPRCHSGNDSCGFLREMIAVAFL